MTYLAPLPLPQYYFGKVNLNQDINIWYQVPQFQQVQQLTGQDQQLTGQDQQLTGQDQQPLKLHHRPQQQPQQDLLRAAV